MSERARAKIIKLLSQAKQGVLWSLEERLKRRGRRRRRTADSPIDGSATAITTAQILQTLLATFVSNKLYVGFFLRHVRSVRWPVGD